MHPARSLRSPVRRFRSLGSAIALTSTLLVGPAIAATPGMVFGPSLAGAQVYGPQQLFLTCSAAAAGGGARLNCTASGFGANAAVTVTIFSTPVELGTFRANTNGVVTVDVALPSSVEPGEHTVTARGVAADGREATASTTVVVPGLRSALPFIASVGLLPRTGSDTIPLATLGSLLIALGGLLVVSHRKRRGRQAPTVTA